MGSSGASRGGGGVDLNAGRTLRTPDNSTTYPLHASGDEFNTPSLDAAWTLRNVDAGHVKWPAVDPGMQIQFDASGDGIWRPVPAGDFEIVLSLRWMGTTVTSTAGIDPSQAMIGPAIIDSAGVGRACCFYTNPTAMLLAVLSAYAYASSPANIAVNYPTYLYHLALRKNGTNYDARYSVDGTNWSARTAASAWAGTPDRIGFGRFITLGGAANIEVVRFNVYAGPGFYS